MRANLVGREPSRIAHWETLGQHGLYHALQDKRANAPVFVLHDVEGFEHNEIAEMVGCSIGNSKSQLHKARLKLRELLRQTEPQSEPGLLKEAV